MSRPELVFAPTRADRPWVSRSHGAQLESAAVMLSAGQIDDARSSLRAILARRPMDAAANKLMCVALGRMGDLGGALVHARRAALSSPRDPEALHNLGKLLVDAGELDVRLLSEGIQALEAALRLEPGAMRTRVHLARALLALGRDADALVHCDGAASDPDLLLVRADALHAIGDLTGALDAADAGLAIAGEHLGLLQRRASLLNYDPAATADSVMQAHRRWGRALESRSPAPLRPRIEHPSLQRVVRVLVLSHDLVRHPVATFAEPLIAGLDRRRFHVTCVNTRGVEDEVSTHLRQFADRWVHAPARRPEGLAYLLAELRPDILIELSGLSAGHALPALAHRPAPVQMTYLGYPATTGLACIDYRLVDTATDPMPGAQVFATEQLVHIPECFLCFTPPRNAPEPRTPRNDQPVLACFNQVFKISDATLAAWSLVLRRNPDAVLRLKAFALREPRAREHLLGRAAAAGIETTRIDFQTWTPGQAAHLDQYNDVDVALDCWPYNGTTTTCEALFMGVPVVTLANDAPNATHASRVGRSLLQAVGHTADIAPSVEAYAERVAALVQARRHRDRDAARAVFLHSPLCDRAGFGRRMSDLLSGIWAERCTRAFN